MTINFKKLHGKPLFDARYMLVPIKSGEKFPGKKNWPKLRATAADIEAWTKSSYYGGFGVLGEFNPGIDIDVQDAEIVDSLVKWCRENIGETPVRTGNPPRVLIPCCAPPGGLGPDQSAKYEDELGQTHQIEIKARGQQWVAYGLHPKTSQPYTWAEGELHSVDSDFLPTLTGDKIQKLFDYFETLIKPGWMQISKGRKTGKVGGVSADGQISGEDTNFENYKPRLNIDSDRVKSLLNALSPDGNVLGMGWRTVGMALYHQYEGSDEGKELFRQWSENSLEYDYDEIEQRWPSWGANTYGGSPITFATVVKMYNEVTRTTDDPTRRKKPAELSEWEKRFVMVDMSEKTEVHDAGVPVHMARRHTLAAFRDQNIGYTHYYINSSGEQESEPMVKAWQGSPNIRHFAGYTYRPGKPRFCARPGSYDDDTQYINNFYFPPHTEDIEDYLDRVKPFLGLLGQLFPNADECAWFTEWLARLIQYPHVRSFVTPINITPVTGTGRGILFDILRLLVGAHNTHDVSPDDMEGRFNNFLDKCLIAVVQEIKANTGARKYQTWERMKSLLADTVANIQPKGEDSYTAPVYANFLMFSNNIDALPINDVNERRIYATKGASTPISMEQIEQVITWKNEDLNISALFKYLKTYPVNLNNFKRAKKTATKVQMVNACTGVGGSDIAAWLQEEAPEVFDFEYASAALEKFSDDLATVGTRRDVFRHIMYDRGYHSVQIRLDGGARKYVFFHPDKTKGEAGVLRGLFNKLKKET